jgi:GMP synthase (glutamine-hydrolysing)
MKIHWFQHVSFEGLGNIEKWGLDRGHSFSVTRFFQNDALPLADEFDWLIVMGGPMGVYDEADYPWLVEEKRFIERAIKTGKPLLGICLGAQLVASALGARVFPNAQKEIGWFPINLTEEGEVSPFFDLNPSRFTVFHWHGDTFDLPPGATLLAESEACKHQAFIYGDRVLGLQFHLESTPQTVDALIQHGSRDLKASTFVQPPERLSGRAVDYERIQSGLHQILNFFENLHSVAV